MTIISQVLTKCRTISQNYTIKLSFGALLVAFEELKNPSELFSFAEGDIQIMAKLKESMFDEIDVKQIQPNSRMKYLL